MTLPEGIIAKTYPDGRTVYRLGSVFDGTPPRTASPYQVGAISVPKHGWFQQWTDRTNCPLVVKRSPAQIIAANRSFPFGETGCKLEPVSNYVFQGPMDNAGVGKYMPSTGERPDIGLVTDPTGLFMLTGNSGPMFAWALAADGVPINYVDANTGKPPSLLQYPLLNTYDGNQGLPRFDKGEPESPGSGYHAYADGWAPDGPHYVSMCFMAFQATLDVGLLANLQHAANFGTISDAGNCSPTKGAVINDLQTRQVAWPLRNILEAHVATMDAEKLGILPDDLLPSSYFKALLDNNLAYYGPQRNDPARQLFRLIGPNLRFGPWQMDYLLSVLAFAVLTGHSDWAPLYLWALGNVIARTNGTSGYPVGWGGAYYLNTQEWKKDAQGNWDQSQYDSSKPLDWYTSFLFQANDPNGPTLSPAEIASLKADPFHGGKAMNDQGNEYLMTTRAVIVMAMYLEKLGLVNVRAIYPELDTCFTNVDRMVRNYGLMNARVSVVLDASAAPVTLPPLPDPAPDPTPDPVPPPAVFPITVHGLLLRAQQILTLVRANK